MTLKESQGGSWGDLGDLKKGDIVKGRIKRLEAFGAFVELHNSTLTGLAHISEVSDDYIKNLQDAFQVGQGKSTVVTIAWFYSPYKINGELYSTCYSRGGVASLAGAGPRANQQHCICPRACMFVVHDVDIRDVAMGSCYVTGSGFLALR